MGIIQGLMVKKNCGGTMEGGKTEEMEKVLYLIRGAGFFCSKLIIMIKVKMH